MVSEILIVDDEEDIRSLLTDILADEGYATRQAVDGANAIREVQKKLPDLILLDIWLNDNRYDGLSVLEILQKEYPFIPVIMISGHGTIETAVTALKKGAFDFVEKPFTADRLLLVVQNGLEVGRLRRENMCLKQKIESNTEIIGSSSVLVQLKQDAERVAPSNSRVFIEGEAGTGKEHIARLIHKNSKRAKEPFLSFNCASMDPERLEIELFGIEPNYSDKKQYISGQQGILEQADGGTLYLDEVAEMPLEMQGKLIRFLQEKFFRRVGGSTNVEVDVRIISSTRYNIKQRIEQKRFREDLYYRLSVVPLRTPSLRDRRGDIPELIKDFIHKATEDSGAVARTLSDDTMMVLQAYDWPGNVRQLKNTVDWILIMAEGDVNDPVTPDMLPSEILGQSVKSSMVEMVELLSMELREARENFERQYLLSQVKRFGGNISKTSNFIGMERSALHRKLRSLGISSDHSHVEKENEGEMKKAETAK